MRLVLRSERWGFAVINFVRGKLLNCDAAGEAGDEG